MTSQELQIIQKVAKKYRRYKFAFYSEEDIEQECIIFGMEGLAKYNGSVPLENFLSVHVRNQLLNLKRKMGISYESGEEQYTKTKFLVMYPIDLDDVDINGESSMVDNNNPHDILCRDEFLKFIDENIDPTIRLDYLKFKEGVKLTKTKKEAVKAELIRILELYEKGSVVTRRKKVH